MDARESSVNMLAMDLHPGEQVVFEGHPSWRALLSFYIGGVLGAAVVGVVVAGAHRV